MNWTSRIIAGVVALVVVVFVLGVAYLYVSGGSGTPSVALDAPTLAAMPLEDPGAVSGLTIFNIVTDQSKVSFTVNEVLNGSPNTVVGTTDQVAGQIGVDFAHPQDSLLGEIIINARTLRTDSDLRDRMIRGTILQSSQDQYELIHFKPTALTMRPASVTFGQPFTFQIVGDLTIRDITKSVTFDTTVTADSQTKLEGTAAATIQRDDFELTIPNVPEVASADEAVKLEIEFVATPVS